MNPRHRQSRAPRRCGFTLVELLVVVGIIVLLVAVSLPAFNIISGGSSVQAAQGVVSAMLSRARAEAIARQRPIGLAVYRDANRDRYAIGLVGFPVAWEPGTNYQRGDAVLNALGTVQLCHTAHFSLAAHSLGNTAPYLDASFWSSPLTTAANGTQRYLATEYVTFLADTDIVYLPPGVGAQLLNDARDNTNARVDRYVGSGVILFDATGRMTTQKYGVLFNPADNTGTPTTAVLNSSRLGLAIQFNATSTPTNIDPLSGASSAVMVSQSGLMLFNRAEYDTQGFQKWDAQPLGAAYSTETTKEAWIDTNATPLLINRFNGTLISAE